MGLNRNGSSPSLIGSEPLLGNDAARSLKAGHLIRNEQEPMTIADGARTLSLGELNWPIIRDNVRRHNRGSRQKKSPRRWAIYFALGNLKCEPTGALTLGAVLTNPEIFEGKKVCIVVSGGNVDREVYQRLISGGAGTTSQ
jgi:threonine dehydratase